MTIMQGVQFRLRENRLRNEALEVAIKLNDLATEAYDAGDKVEASRAMTIAGAIHLAVNLGKESAFDEGAKPEQSAGVSPDQ